MSPLPCKFSYILYTVFSISGFSSQNNVPFRALTSFEEDIDIRIPESAKADWIRELLAKKLMDMNSKLRNTKNELKTERARNIFSKFMCGMNVYRMELDGVISTATDGKKTRITDVQQPSEPSKQIPDTKIRQMKTEIQRILVTDNTEKIKDAFKLAQAFYWVIDDCTSEACKYLYLS